MRLPITCAVMTLFGTLIAQAANTVTVTIYEPLTSGTAAAPELVFSADGRRTIAPVSD